jgi:hypothetical protein
MSHIETELEKKAEAAAEAAAKAAAQNKADLQTKLDNAVAHKANTQKNLDAAQAALVQAGIDPTALSGTASKLGTYLYKSAGGFVLEPYIRVKQKKPLEVDGSFNVTKDDEQTIESIAQKEFTDTVEDYIVNAHKKQAELIEKAKCDDDDGFENYDEVLCKLEIINNWHSITQKAAQDAYDQAIENPYAALYKDSPVGPAKFNPLFGNLFKGSYININQWIASMAGKVTGTEGDTTPVHPILDPLSLHLNPDIGKKPHTEWFDPWMYGLRLVFRPPPLIDAHVSAEIMLHSDSLQAETDPHMKRLDIISPIIAGYGSLSKTVDDDPLDVYNKKTYILREDDRSQVGYFGKGGTLNSYAIPLVEVETEVGSVTSDEKLYAKQLVYDNTFAEAMLIEGKTESEAKNEADIASKEFFEQVNSSVPLNYFTYQNWDTNNIDGVGDDYPLDKLLCRMIKTPEFEKLFVELFPLESYRTLLGAYILLTTYKKGQSGPMLQEYKDGSNEHVDMFGYTKAQLRTVFYSNIMAHDATTNIPLDPSENADKDEEDCDWWCKLGDLLLGNPANYASILALTPVGVLKGMVGASDPFWGQMPWTVPGAAMFILQNALGPISLTWFSDEVSDEHKQLPTLAPPICHDTFKAQSFVKKEYAEEEKEFIAMMKSYGLRDDDIDFIINKSYMLPRHSNNHVEAATALDGEQNAT